LNTSAKKGIYFGIWNWRRWFDEQDMKSAELAIFEIKITAGMMKRKMAMVFNQSCLKTGDQSQEDLEYWLSKTPEERLSAVTFLVNQNLRPFQRMDKSVIFKKLMKA
jgi:hypothetical protein